jgi:hypothetical protein
MFKKKKTIIYDQGIPFAVTPEGLFYCPEERKEERNPAKKYSCPDCRFCQWCAEIRCHSCRKPGKPSGHK